MYLKYRSYQVSIDPIPIPMLVSILLILVSIRPPLHLMVVMGIVLVFNGNHNGVYYVMDSIGGMLNPIVKLPKTHYKKEFCKGFTGKS